MSDLKAALSLVLVLSPAKNLLPFPSFARQFRFLRSVLLLG